MDTESKRKKLSLQLCAPHSPEHVLFTVPQKQSWRKKCLSLQSGSVWAERLTHTAGGYSPAGHTEPRRPLHAMMKQTLGYCVDLKSNNDTKFELKARLLI